LTSQGKKVYLKPNLSFEADLRKKVRRKKRSTMRG